MQIKILICGSGEPMDAKPKTLILTVPFFQQFERKAKQISLHF